MAQSLGAKPVGDVSDKIRSFFFDRVMVTETCHVWTGTVLKSGHGKFCSSDGKKQYLAHRVAYAIAKGDPGDQIVRHKCDNPCCVAPYHLELGYAADNVRDGFERGQLDARGHKNPCHRAGRGVLDAEKVGRIRGMALSGMNNSEIGKALGINRRTISDVTSGKAWSYV